MILEGCGEMGGQIMRVVTGLFVKPLDICDLYWTFSVDAHTKFGTSHGGGYLGTPSCSPQLSSFVIIWCERDPAVAPFYGIIRNASAALL